MRGGLISDTISNMRILRWIAIILFFVLVAALSVHSLNSINQDIGRHLKSGQIIWETKNVYKTNLFSFTEPAHPFINHHWLSEVVFYLLNGLIGLKGLIVFKAGVIVAAFFLIFKSLPKTAGGWPFLLAGIPALFIFSSRTDVRPEIFSYLFLSYFLFAILRAKYSNEHKWLYALPILQIFWTNMHIYFALGPALLLFFLIDRLAYQKEQARLVLKIFIATCVATLINPNFIKGALAPINILRDYGYSIVENQNIFFLTDYGVQLRDIYLFELSLIVLIISFVIAFKNHKKIVFEFLAASVFTILAGKMIRNFGPYALVFLPIVTLNFASCQPKRILSRRGVQACLLSILILAELLLIKSAVNNGFQRWAGRPNRFGLAIPVGAGSALNFVKENKIHGPVFNNFDIGSFLIWKLYPVRTSGSLRDPTSNGTSPDFKVFVDGRPEAYSIEFFEKIYKPMQENPAVWKQLSEKYGINYIFFGHTDMTPWARTFLSHISQTPDWPLIYLDASTAIFIKRTPENFELIKKFQLTTK